MKVLLKIFFIVCSCFTLYGMYTPLENGHSLMQEDSLRYYTPAKEKLSTFERSFKPSYYDTEVYLFKKTDTAKTAGISLDQSYALPETTRGYRVQLFSSNLFDEATAFKNNVNTLFPELWVYMVYETPSYKIRVGDFTNRTAANNLAQELAKKGLRDGWVVPDTIIKNQQPKPPTPIPIDSTSTHHDDF